LTAARGEYESTFSFKDSKMAKLHEDVDTFVKEQKLLKLLPSNTQMDIIDLKTN